MTLRFHEHRKKSFCFVFWLVLDHQQRPWNNENKLSSDVINLSKRPLDGGIWFWLSQSLWNNNTYASLFVYLNFTMWLLSSSCNTQADLLIKWAAEKLLAVLSSAQHPFVMQSHLLPPQLWFSRAAFPTYIHKLIWLSATLTVVAVNWVLIFKLEQKINILCGINKHKKLHCMGDI